MNDNDFENIRKGLFEAYKARVADDTYCTICGKKNIPMYFHAIEYNQDANLELPKFFVPMSGSNGIVRGCFPICINCSTPCSKCGLAMQTEKFAECYFNLKEKYGQRVHAGNGLDEHIHLSLLVQAIYKRIFKIGRFKK